MTKTRILIVDDDVAASRLLAMGLEKTNAYQVRVENVATRAVASVREFRPDLIFLDVCMPGADGGDIAFQIHGDSMLSSIPIVFLTSLVSGQEAKAKTTGVLRGGYEFLPKPASLARVVECIGRHLGTNRESAHVPTA